jgi:peroxiredoxin
MQNRIAVFLVVLMAVLPVLLPLVESVAMDNKPRGGSEEISGDKVNFAANFKLRDINNIEVSLSDFIGKQPVLLFFWTTWCPYCVEALGNLNPRYLQLKQDGCEVLAVNLGESADKVSKYVKKYNPFFKVLVDRDKSVAYAYDVLGVPTYILINKRGEIAAQTHSFPDDYKGLISQ